MYRRAAGRQSRRRSCQTRRDVGAFTAKYSDTQRTAIVTAIVEEGMTAPAAVEAAALGDLTPDLGPFEMPVGTARHIAAAARRRRGVISPTRRREEPVEDWFEDMVRRLVRIFEEEVRRTAAQAQRGELDRDALRQLAKAGKEMGGLVKALPRADERIASGVDNATATVSGLISNPATLALLEDHRATCGPLSDGA
jgi:hypothetical protein